METNTHWRKVFNSDYLGSCDIDEGKDLKLIISKVEIKKIKDQQGKDSERNVAFFTDNKIKPMILNATNCRIIKKFAKSPYIEMWKNIPITVYVQGDIKAFGELTEGLRIRSTQPSMQKKELTSLHTAWANAVLFYKENKTLEKIKAKYEISKINENKLVEEASK